MSEISHFKQVVWAIDPLTRDREFQEVGARVLKVLQNSFAFTIQPVAVILEEQLPYLIGPSYHIDDFKNTVESSISKWIHQFQFKYTTPVTLLIEKQFSVKAGVNCLLNHAKKFHADVIVSTTHSKKRAEFTELGSFSETLFLSSDCPLFLINPKGRVPQSYKEIFFSTDLSNVSIGSLDSIEELARNLHAHVTLFHKVVPFTKDIVEFPYTSDVRSNYLEQLKISAQNKLDPMVSRLTTQGIQSTPVLDRIEAEYVSKSITSRAEQIKDCLIAMVSRTDLGLHSFPGSITRQVLRSTTLPVWVLHPIHKPGIVSPNPNMT